MRFFFQFLSPLSTNLNPHNAPQPPTNKKQKVEPPTSREIQAFYEETATAEKKPVILYITEGFNGTFVQLQSTLPKVLEVYEPDNLTKSLDELISLAQSYPDESITETMIDNLSLLTRQHSKCQQWFRRRAGRITASKCFVQTPINPHRLYYKQFAIPRRQNFQRLQQNGGVNMRRRPSKPRWLST